MPWNFTYYLNPPAISYKIRCEYANSGSKRNEVRRKKIENMVWGVKLRHYQHTSFIFHLYHHWVACLSNWLKIFLFSLFYIYIILFFSINSRFSLVVCHAYVLRLFCHYITATTTLMEYFFGKSFKSLWEILWDKFKQKNIFLLSNLKEFSTYIELCSGKFVFTQVQILKYKGNSAPG